MATVRRQSSGSERCGTALTVGIRMCEELMKEEYKHQWLDYLGIVGVLIAFIATLAIVSLQLLLILSHVFPSYFLLALALGGIDIGIIALFIDWLVGE